MQQQVVLNKEEFEQWKSGNPITLEVFKMLLERKNKIARQLGGGSCLGSNEEHGIAVGRYREITDLEEMTYEELIGKETSKDDERKTS